MAGEFSTMDPVQKAAAVIVSLGAEKASLIYQHLSEEEIERLTIAVAKLEHVEPEETEKILDEFYKTCVTQKIVTEGGIEYARAVLEKAFGEATASTLLQKVTRHLKTRPFEFIRKSSVENLLAFLQHERAQMIAVVLSYADPDQAAALIAELPREKGLKVVECIARMDSASPEAVKIIEGQLKNRFRSILTTDYTTIGGVDYIADVMNHMDRSNEKYIFDQLEKSDAVLAEDIRKKMFVFEDIAQLTDRDIQRFVRECDAKDLVFALKGTDDKFRQLIFRNVSARMAESIQSDLEITVNVRLRDVEEAQQRIVNVIRKLEEAGEININKGGKDDIIA